MQICTLTKTHNHASIPPLVFFTGEMSFQLPNQQHQSIEGSRGMKVNMNKTKVMISVEQQKVMQKVIRCHVVSVVEVLVITQYSVPVVRNGYTRNVAV